VLQRKSIDFCINILMVYHQGDKMGQVKITVSEAVNFRLNVDMINNLKRLARHVSYHLDEDYTYIDIIRCLLAEQFPIPEDSESAQSQLDAAQKLCSTISKQAGIAGMAYVPTVFTTTAYSNNPTAWFGNKIPKPVKSEDNSDEETTD